MKKILILHDLAVGSRRNNRDHVYNYAKYRRGNLYVFHNINAPITRQLVEFPFDGILMNYCFLGSRASVYDVQKERYDFLSKSTATKIAVCQDDYTDHMTLDDWLADINVDVIYSPVQQNLEVLYPKNWGRAKFCEGLTAYTDSKQIDELITFQKPFEERTIDVGTRVRFLPPVFGRYGRHKGQSAIDFRDAAGAAGFNIDISTDPTDVLLGSDWLRFMGNCKFTLGSKGGSSLADPYGDIRRAVATYEQANPEASFDEVERECFAGLDGHYVFAGISPRMFEAAALRTCQILTEDTYVGGIEPYEDYIPLKYDLSNLDEVFTLMRDKAACDAMIDSCYQKLIESNAFDYSSFVDEVLDHIPSSESPLQQQDIDLLEAHFATLEPFFSLKDKFGGNWETAFKVVMNSILYANEHDVSNEISGLPFEAASSPGFVANAVGKGSAVSAVHALLADFHAYTKDDQQARTSFCEILGMFERGELSNRNLTWWDMCEYIYEPDPAVS